MFAQGLDKTKKPLPYRKVFSHCLTLELHYVVKSGDSAGVFLVGTMALAQTEYR